MFEKDAEEYFRDNAHNFDEVTACRECMEYGYNKANEWKYPFKGEYPDERCTLIIYYEIGQINGMTIIDADANDIKEKKDIKAWKKIDKPEVVS
jgi:hypothetical protein